MVWVAPSRLQNGISSFRAGTREISASGGEAIYGGDVVGGASEKKEGRQEEHGRVKPLSLRTGSEGGLQLGFFFVLFEYTVPKVSKML